MARFGETLRQSEWRDELLKCGIRGKGGQRIEFSRLEPLGGTRWLQCAGETRPHPGPLPATGEGGKIERVVVSFGPEHAPLEQRQVEQALEEATQLKPSPTLVVFAAFQFDPEAAKDIDETNWPGVTLLKVQMNTDLLTDDLKKKRASNESYLADRPARRRAAADRQGRAPGAVAGRGPRLRLLQSPQPGPSNRAIPRGSPCGCWTPTTTAAACSPGRCSFRWLGREGRLGSAGQEPEGRDRRGSDRSVSRHVCRCPLKRVNTGAWR